MNTVATTAIQSVSTVSDIYRELSKQQNLRPNKKTNTLFSQLVDTVLLAGVGSADTTSDMSVTEIMHLQQMCSAGEFALESYWTQKIISSQSPWEYLKRFPYFQNYLDLTAFEWKQLQNCQQHQVHTILFVGGGPLPLTAIILAAYYQKSIHIIDCDTEAVHYARALIQALNLTDLITIEHADGSTFGRYEEFNTIYVAALAGTNPTEKYALFQRIKTYAMPDTHILTRSSWGARTALYPPVPREICALFRSAEEFRPPAPIINSAVLLQI